ncbi:FAD binding domain protein [Candidatus Endolissoclinum faulkneri L2]|uniref:FAD binding domain protein n=1 Tax=Candidatus Endolissoclinum faulkneri L2 TaxID=1193729 RepID=K7YJ12_9PROT|nr:FAD-dependent monooxygenase [Candidatus Endolissoclinum faulkneri]AFX99625.1 FAD binding domain protein [Candidatus Endolissoclinum faulkneri L2]
MQVDAIVVGDGISGRLAYRVLKRLGLDAIIIAPKGSIQADHRNTAILPLSVNYLYGLGVNVSSKATPLLGILIESLGSFGFIEERFSAKEVEETYLALNLPISDLANLMPIEKHLEDKISEINSSKTCVTVKTNRGYQITARLVIAADGKSSIAHKSANIRIWQRLLGLSALCVPVALNAPHYGLCIERYDNTGSITIVPLGTHNGSLIRIAQTEMIDKLMSTGLLGIEIDTRIRQPAYKQLKITTVPVVFPLSIGCSLSPARDRIVAVGDAAHVLPPLGAQGWNLAVRDMITLEKVLSVVARVGGDIGSAETLSRYSCQRRYELTAYLITIGILTKIATSTSLFGHLTREFWLRRLSGDINIKHWLMRKGLS